MLSLRERLYGGPTIAGDGPKGTRLPKTSDVVDVNLHNLQNPHLVREIHQSDLSAGAEALTTCTWNAAYLIPRIGEGEVYRLSTSGVRLAREMANGNAYVVAALGPVGWNLEEINEIGAKKAAEYYRVPLLGFKEAGIDGLMLETFTDGDDSILAYKTAS